MIKFAIKQGSLDIIKYILKLKHEKDTLIDNKRFKKIGLQKCLEMSCKQGHLEIVKFLVESGDILFFCAPNSPLFSFAKENKVAN
ncbi:ankyrin repeat protein [Cotonvirus japonicus]|uniref:Ankyrin repeat protein n=1 Tax=Cotonvirus japonicus TaxID=2811091 RepID=A0ABM7NRL0_9VIRU|nr:ankyrin repeat protein [Cotonvirus japonicus]BCS82789.1 ankyrin repeat protein [Cotonvirus japonicus]